MKAETIVWAYIFSVLVGIPLTRWWTQFLYWLLAKEVKPNTHTKRITWMPMLIGIAERAIATTLIMWTPSLISGFIGGWMALKVAGGWGLLKGPTLRNRMTFFIGLLGNVVSLGWAIAVGVYASPEAITMLNSSN